MFERKIYNDIISWHESLKIKKRALIIKGLRQIGKTTIVKKFCEEHYENVVYIDFMHNTSVKTLFDKDLNVNDLIISLSASNLGAKFIPYKTIIIFDELQECANARSAIKPFMEDGRFDLICTGSLLGLRGYNKKVSKGVSTGFEKVITMKPMDFEEYLWAIGLEKPVIEYVKKSFLDKKQVIPNVNEKLMKYFKEYLCVGGLPDVVNVFNLTHDLTQVREIQQSILESYKDDFGKHLNKDEVQEINQTELTKIMQVYKSIPNQLAKENKKFQYRLVASNAKARSHSNAITWLEEFGLISKCYNLNNLELPLDGNKEEDAFKIYVTDTGLFIAMLEEGTVDNIINGDLKVYKGAIFENIIADAFNKMHKDLYYYHKQSGLEIDFVTRYNNELTLIEVKSNNGNAKSLKEVLNNKYKYDINSNFKLADTNIGTTNGINTIPLYMAFLIK